MAATPKIKIGKVSGKTSKMIIELVFWAPRTKAAPIIPINVKDIVPRVKLKITTGIIFVEILKNKHTIGLISINGRPTEIQWAKALIKTTISNGTLDNSNWSNHPSFKSETKNLSRILMEVNKAQTHKIAGDTLIKISEDVPILNGKTNTNII